FDEMVQRPFNFAIVDEVDSILIDEARTPLIISGPSDDSSESYVAVNRLIPLLKPEDFERDEKQRSVTLTEVGQEHIEELLGEANMLENGSLYDIHNVSLVHHVNQALRAHKLFSRDVDYIVKDDKVVIIDEFTGRMMEGRRFSEGLHQALEAKEQVKIQVENQTLASITYQNYFRLYPKLSGMTGTANTEAAEFSEIYKLEVAEVPTNVAVARIDSDDEVYRTAEEKNQAIAVLIEECRQRNQPVLVGTVSIEKSEHLSDLLKSKKIPHQVLNARYHEQEAYIIAQAGRPGAVTIATNMAGRGTDIQLGGNLEMRIQKELEKVTEPTERAARIKKIEAEISEAKQVVKAAGGLFVIGTERHESRRIDNQLRGRSGRQGDPGASRFFLSLEDDLMRIFGSERMDSMLQKLGLKEGEAIVHRWINKALEKAQQKVEARNFEIRKNLLKFDDVMNDQRKVIYEQRREIMGSQDISETIVDMRHSVVNTMVDIAVPPNSFPDQWDLDGLGTEMMRLFGFHPPIKDWAKEDGMNSQTLTQRLLDASDRKMAEKVANYGAETIRMAEKSLVLQILDQSWKDHLLLLDHLRQGIGLRAYAQKDPLNEYKKEAFNHFEQLLDQLRDQVTMVLGHIEFRDAPRSAPSHIQNIPAPKRRSEARAAGSKTLAVNGERISRNEPCPCGSGKKYKFCHGSLT
ncbi:MAG: preprotein translocase subunit SecA, partial [Candidatus Pacebacteria bacterium]|nr:preprotein translocase subunit SecA [Candidatus Paceibacterota bacterium]